MKKHLGRLLRIGFIVFVSTLILAAVVLANQGGESRFVIPGGGGIELEGGEIKFAGAIGQPIAGWVKKSGYTLCSGFWCGGSGVFITKVYVPLVVRNFPLIHQLGDAPANRCDTPRPMDLYPPNLYLDDFRYQYDTNWYTFNAIAGNTYTIRTSDVSDNVTTVLFLFTASCPSDPSGSYITCLSSQCIDEDEEPIAGCECHSPTSPIRTARIDWGASSNSNPKIFVREYNWNPGNYTLRVEKTP